MNTRRLMASSLGACAMVLALGACTDSLGLDAAGNLAVTLQRAGAPAFGYQPQGSPSETRAISPDTVSAFFVTVTSVEVYRATADSSGGIGWVSLHMNSPVTVNLMTMTQDDASAILLASGNVASGLYTRVRMGCANPRITFRGSIDFGAGGSLQGGVTYGVHLVSSTIETAISTAVSASASSQSAAHLVFEPATSMGTVTLDGSSAVALAAVITGR